MNYLSYQNYYQSRFCNKIKCNLQFYIDFDFLWKLETNLEQDTNTFSLLHMNIDYERNLDLSPDRNEIFLIEITEK